MMRKYWLLILASVFMVSGLSAQGVTFGIKGGANLAKLTNNDDFEFKFGLHFGGVAEIPISDAFKVQPEILYSAQGYRQDFNGQRVKGLIDYLNIPVLGSYRVAEGLSLQVGPQLGINIRSDLEVEGSEQGTIFANDIDVSAAFGFQYLFDDTFFAQLRGTIGLTDVLTNVDQKHLVISASFGVLFDNGGNDD